MSSRYTSGSMTESKSTTKMNEMITRLPKLTKLVREVIDYSQITINFDGCSFMFTHDVHQVIIAFEIHSFYSEKLGRETYQMQLMEVIEDVNSQYVFTPSYLNVPGSQEAEQLLMLLNEFIHEAFVKRTTGSFSSLQELLKPHLN